MKPSLGKGSFSIKLSISIVDTTIDKIFEQSDQMKLAIEAYEITFKYLKASDFANENEKTDWESSITKKIDELKGAYRT